jgi:hypothetical protein
LRKQLRLSAIISAAIVLLSAIMPRKSDADDTFVYAVQISAIAQRSPPTITLRWQPDPYGANSYTIYRKTRDATQWGSPIPLSRSTTTYVDTTVVAGSAYEYQIIKEGVLGYTGTGYIYAGLESALTENRGKLILIIENTYVSLLSNELARLETDLVGDGWQVIRHDVSSTDAPANIRNQIAADYNSDPGNVQAVFLFGHVPVYRSGNLDYDGHGARPMPADAYYGDVDGNWQSAPSFIPSNVELMVGRVDFANMPGNNAPAPWPSEPELLRNYLNKDHAWRHRLMTAPRRALMGNRAGDFAGEAFAASGYRGFEPFVGPNNIVEANVADNAPASERWISQLGASRFLWAYGCGGGDFTSISQLGTHGIYNDVWSTDIMAQNASAAFVMLYGSHFGEWDAQDDFMRTFLATPSLGLAACLSGRPHWFPHHFGLGEPIGFTARVTINNSTLYQTQTNAFTRGVHIALMGDPTLRMDAVAPPSNLQTSRDSGGVNLTWTASSDSVLGYHIYRSATAQGPFVRLNSAIAAGTTFNDASPGVTNAYMVRAVKLQTTPSGTYYNASQGIFASYSGATSTAPISVSIRRSGGNLTLTWTSQRDVVYRVLAKDSYSQSEWLDVSGPMAAAGLSTSWVTSDPTKRTQRFYKIASP